MSLKKRTRTDSTYDWREVGEQVRPGASLRPGLREALAVAHSGGQGWLFSATAGLSLTAASTAAR